MFVNCYRYSLDNDGNSEKGDCSKTKKAALGAAFSMTLSRCYDFFNSGFRQREKKPVNFTGASCTTKHTQSSFFAAIGR